MESKLLGKLHEIIIECARQIYEEGASMATSNGLKYPYEGPIFAFQIDDESLNLDELKLIDNAEEQIPVDHGKFIEPKRNQVRGAFKRFRYWEDKIHSDNENLWRQVNAVETTEIRIVTEHLLEYTIEMLTALAESYSIWEVDPETGWGYWAYPGMHAPLAVYGLHVLDGQLRIDNTAPDTLQLKVEEFNDIIAVEKKIASGSVEGISRQIVCLLKEVIVERAQGIYDSQKNKLSEFEDGELQEEHIELGNGLISIQDGKLFSANPHTRYPIGWEELRDLIHEFNLWQTEINESAENNYNIFKNELLRLTSGIIRAVCHFLTFTRLDTRTDTPDVYFGFAGISAPYGRIEVDASVSQSTRDKVTRCNVLLQKLSWKAQQLRLQSQLNTVASASNSPGNGERGDTRAEIVHRILELESTASKVLDGIKLPYETADSKSGKQQPETTKSPKPNRKRTRDKSEPDIHREKIIRQAIKDGLRGARYCSFLDANHVEPRKSWKGDALWPGSYQKAYKIAEWRHKIQDEKSDIKRLLNSATRQLAKPRESYLA